MFKFGKKKEEVGEVGEGDAAPEDGSEEKKPESESTELSGNVQADLVKLGTEVDRLKVGNEAFKEVRKANTEMFTRINEQVGELRSMIFDRDRTIQTLELKAVKAADLVESIQPDKFMSELTKQSVKIEALKANIESNEAIMERIMDELKGIRKKVEFFRGIEEIVKLSQEIKKELIDIKKVEGKINIEADKVETIYAELRKRIQELDAFSSEFQEIKAEIGQHTKDVDFLKMKVSGMADKEEVDKILEKITEYTKTVGDIKKKSSLTRDLEQLKTMIDGMK